MKLEIFGAASALIEKRGWLPHFAGFVVAPTYPSQIAQVSHNDRPFIVDNGAWSDYTNRIKTDAPTMQKRTLHLIERVEESGSSVRFAVLPDRVGSWRETVGLLDSIEPIKAGVSWALPIQDNYKIREIRRLIDEWSPSHLFIGGSDYSFKRAAVRELRFFDIPIHVGRISSFNALVWCANASVESVDSSAWSRPARPIQVARKGRILRTFQAMIDGRQDKLRGVVE